MAKHSPTGRGASDLLRQARQDGPSPEQLQALQKSLGPIAGGSPALPLAAASPALPAFAWVGALALVTGLTIAAVQKFDTSPPDAPAEMASKSASAPKAAIRFEVIVPVPTIEVVEATPAPAVSTERRHRPQLDEAALIDRARASLRRAPARSLRLCREHRRRFPEGILSQERTVVSIDALSRLGRHRRARSVADRFLRSHPGSIHRPRIDTILGRGNLRRPE